MNTKKLFFEDKEIPYKIFIPYLQKIMLIA